ncbi:MAG: hypothetical protein ACXABY_17170, partial [Candidatus Thorarchaeota archaeon]
EPRIMDCIGKDDKDIGSDIMPKVCSQEKGCFVYTEPKQTEMYKSGVYVRDIGTICDYLRCQEEWKES